WTTDKMGSGPDEPASRQERTIVGQPCKTTETKAGEAERCTDRCTHKTCESREPEDILRPTESFVAVGKPIHQVATCQRFDSISHSDTDGGCHRARSCDVYQECAKEDAGPNLIPQNQ